MKIAIIVDNPLRDLSACALLAAELSKTHETYLISASNAGTEIFELDADLVLLNSLRETNKALVYKLIKSQIAYSVLDTEGGVFMKIPDSDETTYTITLPKDPLIRKNLAQYFVWGTDTTAELIRRKLFEPEKLLCLGTPRMDFFAGPLTEVIKANRNQGSKRPMILVNTSFAGNNPRYSNRTDEVKMLVSKFNYTPEFINEFFDNLDKTHFAYIDLTLFLAKKFPEVDFVLRPHPFESEEVYKQRFAGQSNIKVLLTGAAAEWITEASALVHFECSTAIESAFLGKPVFSLSEFRYVRPLPHVQAISDYASSAEEMVEKLQLVLAGTYKWPQELRDNLKQIESQLYFRVDGQSYLRLANAINEFAAKHYRKPNLKARFYRMAYNLFFKARSVAKLIVKGALIPAGKKIQAAELESFLSRLSTVFGKKISFRKIGKTDIYQIQG